jgi:phospholipid transport system transporter-binding protein
MIEVNGEVLSVTVPMTLGNATALEEKGLALLPASSGVVELQGVSELDSSALAVIFSWQRAAKAAGREVRIAHAPASLLSLAALYDVADQLTLI